jgi:hypothetical protein
MKPRVRQAVAEAAFETGIKPDILIGPKRRQTDQAVKLRRAVIAKLYNPASVKRGRIVEVTWGISDVGRALDLDHTTVLHHVRVMGLHRGQSS